MEPTLIRINGSLAFLIFSFFAIVSPITNVKAQSTPAEVKELKRKIQTGKTDNELVTSMMSLAFHYVNSFQPDSAIIYALRSKEYLKKETFLAEDSARRAIYERWILSELARAYMLKQDDKKLKETISEFISVTNNNTRRLQDHYFIIGYYYKRWYKDHLSGLKQAIHYLDSSQNLASELRLSPQNIHCQLEKIECHQSLGNLDSAELLIDQLQHFQKSVNYDSLSGWSYFMRYHNKVIKGQYNLALENLFTAMELIEKYRDELLTADIYMAVASTYQEMGKVEESIKWHVKALEDIEEKINNGGRFLTNLQSLYFMESCALVEQLLGLNRKDEAHDLIQKATKNYPPTSDVQKARAAQMTAYYYDATNNRQLAYINYIEMARFYDLVHRMEQPGSFEKAMNDIGSFLIKEKKFIEARRYILKAIAGKYTQPLPIHVSRSYNLLYKVDSAQGNYLASLENLLKHKRIQDSIFNERKGYQMEELQVRYAVDQKEKDILVLQGKEQLKNAELQQASLIQKLFISGIIILAFLLFFTYKQMQLKRRTNLQLESQQREIASQNTILKHLVEEKEWLLKEVHHRVKNNLHMITSLLSSQAFQLTDEMAKIAVKDSQNRIQAMSMVHQKLYIHDNISSIDSTIYICDLIEYLKSSFSIENIEFKADVESIKLDSQYAIPIGLIVNEAVTNSIKYAFPDGRSGVVMVSFHNQKEKLLLSITDNGVGFSHELKVGQRKSLGMTLIKGLAHELGAEVEIKSNHGTSITVNIPVDKG